MTKTLKSALAAIPFLLAAACGDPARKPAEAAVQAAQASAQTLTDEVASLAPDQTKAARRQLDEAEGCIAKQDYKGALAVAKDIPAMAAKAVADAKAKKDELAKAAAQQPAELRANTQQPADLGAKK